MRAEDFKMREANWRREKEEINEEDRKRREKEEESFKRSKAERDWEDSHSVHKNAA